MENKWKEIVVVTGATGFVAAHIIDQLLERGFFNLQINFSQKKKLVFSSKKKGIEWGERWETRATWKGLDFCMIWRRNTRKEEGNLNCLKVTYLKKGASKSLLKVLITSFIVQQSWPSPQKTQRKKYLNPLSKELLPFSLPSLNLLPSRFPPKKKGSFVAHFIFNKK